MVRIAIFASGAGTNAAAICRYFQHHDHIQVDAIVSNHADAKVKDVASQYGITFQHFGNRDFESGEGVLQWLKNRQVQWVVLAGFLRLLPENLIREFDGRILNIHPSLLPEFGGKGMFGLKVHRAVIAAGKRTTGLSIHLVNERFDEGKVLYQQEVEVLPGDDEFSLAKRVQEAEHEAYPRWIEKLVLQSTPL